MSAALPPFLHAVAQLDQWDRNDRYAGRGTCFFCRVRHPYDIERESLFLVTSAHVIDKDCRRLDVLFPPIGGGLVTSFAVTAEIGVTAATWEVDRKQDLAVLRLDGEHLPTDEIRRRSLDLDNDSLAVWELRWLRVGPGDEAFLVGFVNPYERGDRQFPGVRLATISRLARRVSPSRPFVLDGVSLPGNSGSPIVLRRNPTTGGGTGSGAAGKLIGVACRAGNMASVIRSDDNGVPIEARESVGRIHIVPVNVLRRLVGRVFSDVFRTEVAEPKLRRWWGWLRGRRQAD